MSEEQVIRNCAPTLAGLKTGNLFSCHCDSKEAALTFARNMNRRLGKKGIRFLPLRFTQGKALFYLFRPAKLRKDLSCSRAKSLLDQRGYRTEKCESCVVDLAHRLQSQEDFPHEIGLFLGYPAEDVQGFMDNEACGHKCVGCWKVYGDEEAARKTFAKFKHCTRVYCQQWEKNQDMERLTVAG